MRTRDHEEVAPLVNLADITEIELVILKRMNEVTIGDHRSRQHGGGFDFIGLRDWQAGDRLSSIDWAQSSLTNFSPLVVREFEQPSTATIMVVADVSTSTRCGVQGVPIAAAIARTIATIGMSAVFFQDPFGLVTFDTSFASLGVLRPRTGKGHIVHCLDAYQFQRGVQPLPRVGSISDALSGVVRRQALLPVVSDFLFDDAEEVLRELSHVKATHDIFGVMIDSAFAYDVPHVSAGWIDVVDVETGRAKTMSRRAFGALGEKARRWQARVRQAAKDLDVDLVTVGLDQTLADIAVSEFVVERRLRKTRN